MWLGGGESRTEVWEDPPPAPPTRGRGEREEGVVGGHPQCPRQGGVPAPSRLSWNVLFKVVIHMLCIAGSVDWG